MIGNLKRLVPFMTAFLFVIITGFALFIYGTNQDVVSVGASVADEEIEEEENEDSSTSDEHGNDNGNEEGNIQNSIESNIDTGDGEVENTIENNINGNGNEVSNSIENVISGNGSIINNTIFNEIEGDGSDLDNFIENDIFAEDGADVTNNINNNILGNFNNITNNIINNIEIIVDGDVENDVNNEVEGNGDGEEKNGEDPNGNGENGEANGDTPESIWGVDSASLTDEEMLTCIRENFGDPQVYARYLGDKEGVSYGLTHEEVELLHSNEIDIMVIWNHFEDARGYEKGQSEANDAIEMAREFGVPEGVALFANVEPIYPIDAEFILGWYDTLAESEYESGVYGIFSPDRDLYVEYEMAAEENPDLLENNYVWTSYPEEGVTTEENAPEYNPVAPEGSLLAGWQYGIEAETCNIDTNLFDGEVLDVLWAN
ncbi:DUF1906 domain-containing protein [Bacillus shivajii]|uniref:glycoside hydrolase domain-containing protein n=1 Tax=Bacillus shivajii TaxID=1983719 RepID=UPI001CFAF785|nr:glycoside hydrolase domain-containing protein [Bacillus shivajii]UCZ51924.1 DUF1906 domain-containing protein [Bacillus shivajii]